MRAYLAGAIQGSDDGGAGWRKQFAEALRQLKIDYIDPVDEDIKAYGNARIAHAIIDTDPSSILKVQEEIRPRIDRDIAAVLDCDFVVAYYDKAVSRGAGTQGEITLAYAAMRPAYILCGKDTKVSEIPFWIIGCATEIFTDPKDLLHYIAVKYPQPREPLITAPVYGSPQPHVIDAMLVEEPDA